MSCSLDNKSIILSICIPTFNRKSSLERLITYLLPQCLDRPIEIIISDNASTDGTEELCAELELKFNNILYFKHSQNTGFANNLVFALSKGQGKYLWMLSDDELLHPSVVKKILMALDNNDPAWLIFNFAKISSDNDDWDVNKYFKIDTDIYSLSIDSLLRITGSWASFMSINIISSDVFANWQASNTMPLTDYVGFDICLSTPTARSCTILASPLAARMAMPLNQHRFTKFDTYLFDFFKPLDKALSSNKISLATRNLLAYEIFKNIAGPIILKAKLNDLPLPPIVSCIQCHWKSFSFWLIIPPLLLFPRIIIYSLLKTGLFILKPFRFQKVAKLAEFIAMPSFADTNKL